MTIKHRKKLFVTLVEPQEDAEEIPRRQSLLFSSFLPSFGSLLPMFESKDMIDLVSAVQISDEINLFCYFLKYDFVIGRIWVFIQLGYCR